MEIGHDFHTIHTVLLKISFDALSIAYTILSCFTTALKSLVRLLCHETTDPLYLFAYSHDLYKLPCLTKLTKKLEIMVYENR